MPGRRQQRDVQPKLVAWSRPWDRGDAAVLQGLEAQLNGEQVILAEKDEARMWTVFQCCDLPQRNYAAPSWHVRESNLKRFTPPIEQLISMSENGDTSACTLLLKVCLQLFLFQPSEPWLLDIGKVLEYLRRGVKKGHLDSHYLLAFAVCCGIESAAGRQLKIAFEKHVSEDEALKMLRVAANRGHESSAWLLRQVCLERGWFEEAAEVAAKIHSTVKRTRPKHLAMSNTARHDEIVAEEAFEDIARVVQCFCNASLDYVRDGQADKARHAVAQAEAKLAELTNNAKLLTALSACPRSSMLGLSPMDILKALSDQVDLNRNLCREADHKGLGSCNVSSSEAEGDGASDVSDSEESSDSFMRWIGPLLEHSSAEGKRLLTQREHAAEFSSELTACRKKLQEKERFEIASTRLQQAVADASGPNSRSELESAIRHVEVVLQDTTSLELRKLLHDMLCDARHSIQAAIPAARKSTSKCVVPRPASLQGPVPRPALHRTPASARSAPTQEIDVEAGPSRRERQRLQRQRIAAKKREEAAAAERTSFLTKHPGIMGKAASESESSPCRSLVLTTDAGTLQEVLIMEPEQPEEAKGPPNHRQRQGGSRRQNALTLSLATFHDIVDFEASESPALG